MTSHPGKIFTNSPKRSQIQLPKRLLEIILYLLLIQLVALSSSQAALLIKNKCDKITNISDCAVMGGIEYFYIYDQIDSKTAIDFMLVSGQIPLNKPFPKVYLNSKGGNVLYARLIGRILRVRSASVEGRDMISPEREPRCASACIEVAAGGVKRNFIQLQVHKGYLAKRIKGEIYKYSPMPESEQRETSDYFAEMGIDHEIIDLINNTTEKKEWSYITYNDLKPFHEQKIYKLGFLMDEDVAKSLYKLHQYGEQDDWTATHANHKLAEQGDARAAYVLGHRYLHGVNGEEKNSQQALNWFQKAGERGEAGGFHMLGVIYDRDSEVVKQDLTKSTQFYRKAAELGFSGSQNNLSWAYYKGHGVKRNVPEAIYWATRAAEQGEPFAYSTLSELRFEGNGFPTDDVETLKWTILALQGMPYGKAKLGICKQFDILTKRMSKEDISKANQLAKNWQPLVDGGSTMRDKDDR